MNSIILLITTIFLLLFSESPFFAKEMELEDLHSEKIESLFLSENGQHTVLLSRNADNHLKVYFNGELTGTYDNIYRISREGAQIMPSGNDFYLVGFTDGFKQAVMTRGGMTEPLADASDRAVFTEEGEMVFAYATDSSTNIRIKQGGLSNDLVVDSNTSFLGPMTWNKGDYKLVYEVEDQQYITSGKRSKELLPKQKLYIDRVTLGDKGERFFGVYRTEENGEKQYYVTSNEIADLGPFDQLSAKVTFDAAKNRFGFVFLQNDQAFVQVNEQKFGPYPPFTMASNLVFTGSQEDDFAYYYLTGDKALFIQTKDEIKGPFIPKSLRGSKPVLSASGNKLRINSSTPEGDYVQINDQYFGPYDNADRGFYKPCVSDEITLFKFKKHGKAFLYVDRTILGPYAALDYEWHGGQLSLATVDVDQAAIDIEKYGQQELAELKGFNLESWLSWSPKIRDHVISIKVPFGWNTVNVSERIKLLPMVMLSPKPTAFDKIVESINKQYLPPELDQLVVVSLQGDALDEESMKEVMQQNLLFGQSAEILEEMHKTNLGNREMISVKGRIKRPNSESLIMKQYAFEINDQWLLCQAYGTDEERDVFQVFDEMVERIELP